MNIIQKFDMKSKTIFFEKEISSTKNRVKQLQNLRKNFKKRLKKVAKY